MAAEAQRATCSREQTDFASPPRMPAHPGTLAATARALVDADHHASASASMWVDLGGILLADTDGHRFIGWPTAVPDPSGTVVDPWSHEGTAGARRIMMLMLAVGGGTDALGSVFTVAARRN